MEVILVISRLLLALTVILLVGPMPADSQTMSTSWQDMVFMGISRQTADWDCGPAALKTILSLLDWPDPQAEKVDPPIHMAHLQDMFAHVGLPAQGFRLLPEQLWWYYEQSAPVPMVVHLQWPEPHFSVLAASWQQWLLLADPGIGWNWVSRTEFMSIWTGYVLLPDPPKPWQQPAIIDNLVTRLQTLSAAQNYY